jgi:glutaryl-CoA dehydrogenase
MVTLEMSRGDGSVNTFLGVQNGLAMGSINLLGSTEQKERWLPAMARLDKIGAFALTEPNHGSDSVALETTARQDGDHWLLNGAKRWIGNGNIAHVVIVWARDVADGKVKGFVLEKNADGSYPDGYATDVITGKIGKRAARTVCLEARDILGGNGLLLDFHVARHMTDMEVVHTYEGTDSIQSVIVGRDVTGISAFA